MGGDSAPSGPTAEQQEQLAEQKAALRRKQQKIANEQVANLRASSTEGGLLRGAVPTLLAPAKPPPATKGGGIFGKFLFGEGMLRK